MQASFQFKSRSRRTSHHSGYTYAHIESSKSSLSHDDMVRHHSSFAIRQLQGTSSWTSSLSHANKNQTTDRTLPLYHSYTPNPKITPPTPATTKSANSQAEGQKPSNHPRLKQSNTNPYTPSTLPQGIFFCLRLKQDALKKDHFVLHNPLFWWNEHGRTPSRWCPCDKFLLGLRGDNNVEEVILVSF